MSKLSDSLSDEEMNKMLESLREALHKSVPRMHESLIQQSMLTPVPPEFFDDTPEGEQIRQEFYTKHNQQETAAPLDHLVFSEEDAKAIHDVGWCGRDPEFCPFCKEEKQK